MRNTAHDTLFILRHTFKAIKVDTTAFQFIYRFINIINHKV